MDPSLAPPGEQDLASILEAGLTPRQVELLLRSGYPYMFEEWQFHVTLTRRLAPEERAEVLPAVAAWLGDAPARPRRVGAICLFTQAAAGAPFLVAQRLPLTG